MLYLTLYYGIPIIGVSTIAFGIVYLNYLDLTPEERERKKDRTIDYQ